MPPKISVDGKTDIKADMKIARRKFLKQISLWSAGALLIPPVFDKNRCLPHAENKACIVCEEHCPVHDKAIQFDEIKIVEAGESFFFFYPLIFVS